MLSATDWRRELTEYKKSIIAILLEERALQERCKREITKLSFNCKICEQRVLLVEMRSHSHLCLEKQELQKQLAEVNKSLSVEISKKSLRIFKEKFSREQKSGFSKKKSDSPMRSRKSSANLSAASKKLGNSQFQVEKKSIFNPLLQCSQAPPQIQSLNEIDFNVFNAQQFAKSRDTILSPKRSLQNAEES